MRIILCLGLAAFASSVSQRALDPMLPVISADLGVSLSRAALLASAYSFPYAAMQLVLGPMADAVGKVRMICIAVLGIVAGSAWCALAPGFTGLIVGRMIAGGSAGGVIPVAFALIGDTTPYSGRQLAISRLLIISIAGQMAGAAAAGFISEAFGWRAVFVVAAAIALASLAVVLIFLRGAERHLERPTLAAAFLNYARIMTDPLALLVYAAVFGEGVLFFGIFPFVASMLGAHGGGGAREAGIVLSAYAVGGVIYAITAQALIPRLGPWRMMRVGGTVAGTIYLATALPLPWQAVAVLFFVAGYGYLTMHNTLQAIGTELAPGARGAAVALFSAFLFLGYGTGPVVGGAIGQEFGYAALFGGAGILIVALGWLAAWAIGRVSGRGRPGAATP